MEVTKKFSEITQQRFSKDELNDEGRMFKWIRSCPLTLSIDFCCRLLKLLDRKWQIRTIPARLRLNPIKMRRKLALRPRKSGFSKGIPKNSNLFLNFLKSEFFRAEEDREIVKMWRQMDEKLEHKAKSHNLSAINVKSILHVRMLLSFFTKIWRKIFLFILE